ncbi:hypothetical protein VAR608DRAFT_2717 [Variovorax sp. HW608]|uniref:hypothetical protein n=1 Tax=Variovorax sp. HW608 TaxID=1034889 RepID=UPI00081F9CE1|nr:hypothetical protein [Variovorax sp. HW608]SCK31562.1 hypothetical protein VAR608DRAFT_2717 [Variovorax sp. HW608]
MKEEYIRRAGPAVLATCVLGLLLLRFGGYLQAFSYDLVQHYLLVDELSRNGAVRPDAFERIGAMAIYPPIAHWLATLIGWIGGSGLVGITLVAISGVFFSYWSICRLAGDGSLASLVVVLAAFILLEGTRSFVGWEVVANFFFPQIVADAVYFGALIWLTTQRSTIIQIFGVLLVGAVAMSIQPLVAIHLLAVGCVLVSFETLQVLRSPLGRDWRRACGLWLVILAASIAIVVLHPAFKTMREISSNNGYLEFGYTHVLRLAVACGAIGAFCLWRCWRGRGTRTDVVLSSALVGAAGLCLLQFALLFIHGDGSLYAVKKHMFLVVTLTVINAARVLTSPIQFKRADLQWVGWLAPLTAGFMSMSPLAGFNTPVVPIVRALAYANHAADYALPGFRPGNTVADVAGLPTLGNVLVSVTAFQHRFDATVISWQQGANIRSGAELAMIRRSPNVVRKCPMRSAESASYVVVDPACLHSYRLGDVLRFAEGGNGWDYVSSGWGAAEPWGAWTFGDVGAVLELELSERALPSGLRVDVEGMAWLPPEHPTQAIAIEINGREVAQWKFSQESSQGTRTAHIPPDLVRGGRLRIVLRAPGAVSPLQLGIAPDARVLGMGVKSFSVRAEGE